MSGTDATVLVVDDDESLNDLYVDRLEREYTVRAAYSAEEALEKLDETVDVVLLDRRMPGLSGDDLLVRIRELGYECRVAMLTAVEPDVDILEMDCDDYLTKPIDDGELRDLVASLLVRGVSDEPGRTPLSLAAKKTALEANLDPSEYETTEEYRELLERLDAAREEVRGHLEDLESAGTDGPAGSER